MRPRDETGGWRRLDQRELDYIANLRRLKGDDSVELDRIVEAVTRNFAADLKRILAAQAKRRKRRTLSTGGPLMDQTKRL
jgi:hypothetical protein